MDTRLDGSLVTSPSPPRLAKVIVVVIMHAADDKLKFLVQAIPSVFSHCTYMWQHAVFASRVSTIDTFFQRFRSKLIETDVELCA